MSGYGAAGHHVEFKESVQLVPTGRPAVEGVFRKGLVDRVLAALAHPESVQHVTPALGAQVGAAHLLFVRFFQIIKALSILSTVGGAGRRTERPKIRRGRRTGGPLLVTSRYRQPAAVIGSLVERRRRGGGKRQAGHQEQQEARRGPEHSAGQGALAVAAAAAAAAAARSSAAAAAATSAGSIAAGGRSAPPRGSDCAPEGRAPPRPT